MLTGRRGCGRDAMHAPCSKLARVDTIWVMVTDSTVNSGSTSAYLPHQMPRSPRFRLLADGLSQQRCCQVREDHLAGKDRHNYGHEMTPGELPASLHGILTESTVCSEDRIWPGLDS